MRNVVSLLKQYPLAVALSILIGASAAPAAVGPEPQDVRPPGTRAPQLARLFVPQHVPEGTYTVTVLSAGIEAASALVREAVAAGARPGDPAGSWEVHLVEPLEAFGTGSRYDRSKLARLYTGRPVSVVRGPVERDRRVVAAVTLLSPYPDATISRLNEGTLVILMRTR